jgi:hypothetical protein
MATDLAQKWLIEHEPSEIREAAEQILRGEYVGPAENRFADMPPEDLVIEWLRDSSLESEYREAILGACKETLAQSHVALVTGEMLLDSATLIRLCRIVDVAAPQELYGAVTALLTLVLRTPNVPASVVTAAVRAGMAYRLTKEDMPLWEVVASRPETSAYGVNALLRIAPDSECIPKLLVQLWIHQLADGWNVDVPFLVRMAARKTDDRQLPYVVTEAVQKAIVTHSRATQLKNRLVEDLAQRPWSRSWNSSFGTLSGLTRGSSGNRAVFQKARTYNHTIRKSVAAELDRRGIDVRISVQNGVVTLSGEVKSAEQYRAAQCLAMGVKGVKKVVNQVSVVRNRIRSRKAKART